MRKLMIVLGLLFVPCVVLAQTVTSTTVPDVAGDPGAFVGLLAKAFSDKDWMVLAGLILTGVIGFARLFGLQKLVPKKHTHWLAGGMAMATSVAVGLMAHAGWWTIVSTGVGTGVVAVGGWQLIFEPVRNFLRKKLAGEPEKKPAPPPPPEADADDKEPTDGGS